MAESDFGWFKIGSFIGTGLLILLCFIMLGFGISNVVDGNSGYGIPCIISGTLAGALGIYVYLNYQKKGNH